MSLKEVQKLMKKMEGEIWWSKIKNLGI
jgi:hypothetical protein